MINYIWLIFDASFFVIFCEYIRDDIKAKKIDALNIIGLISVIFNVIMVCFDIFKQNLN